MKHPIPKSQALADEAKALYDVLNDESDLACVLIGTSYLDYALASLLKHHFIESSVADKILNAPSGVLSTFASRYDIAYCLGLIPKGLYRNLEVVGRVRNAFAHSYLTLDFDHPEVAKLIDSLTFPAVHESFSLDESRVRSDNPNPFGPFTQPRNKFTIVLIMMVNRLLMTGLATEHQAKLRDDW